jgi:hypothetical protein
LLHRLGHDQAGQITFVGVIPTALAAVSKTQPQEKTFQTLPGFALAHHAAHAGADKISHRFILLVRHVDAGQFTRAKETGQLFGITPIGLDPGGSLFGHKRWGYNDAVKSFLLEITMNDVAAGTRFVDEAQLHVLLGQFLDQFFEGIQRAADDAVVTHFTAPFRGDDNSNGFLMDVQTDVMHGFLHGCLVSFIVYQWRFTRL